MKIREIFEDKSADDLSLKLSAAVNQIAGRVIDTGSNTPMSLTALINMLADMGLNVSENQFRDMVDNPPLNNTIASVEGDNVTFIGQRKDTNKVIKPDQTTATLEKMAKRAGDKRT